MALTVNGSRPEKISINENEILLANVSTGNSQETCIWAKRLPFEIPSMTGGSISVSKITKVCDESTLGTVNDGDYIYCGDVIQVTSTPDANCTFLSLKVSIENKIEYTFYNNPQTVEFGAETIGTEGTKVSIYALFNQSTLSWHTIYTGTYSCSMSNSTSLYTSTTFTPTGYQALTDTSNTRLCATLLRKKTTASSWTTVKTYTQNVGSITYTDTTISSTNKLYLDVLTTGIRSRVKSVKKLTVTYQYMWRITKVEQYY